MLRESAEQAGKTLAGVDDTRQIGEQPAGEIVNIEPFARFDGIEQLVTLDFGPTVIEADAGNRVLDWQQRAIIVALSKDA